MDRYEQLLDEAIDEHRRDPVDILGIGDTGEHGYLVQHKDGFVRTVHDVDEWCQAHGGAKRILEIGPFLGTVSVTLKGLGHDVSAVDLPEYAESPRLQAYFQRHGVSLHGANLRDHSTSMSEDDLVVQRVEMVFKTIRIEYRTQDRQGDTTLAGTFSWDIPSGTASPSA